MTQKPTRGFDAVLLVLVLVFLVVGLVMVQSASGPVASEHFGDAWHYVRRQGMGMGVGAVGLVALAVMPHEWVRGSVWAFYGTCVVLLVVVLFFPAQNGAHRWISVPGVNFQPSEFAKIAVIGAMAHLVDRYKGKLDDWRNVAKILAVPAPVVGLLLLEPDFGTTVIVCGMSMLALYVGGLRTKWLWGLGLAGLTAGVPAMLLASYRVERLRAFFDPWADPSGNGYQTIQSMIAFHNGGLFGRGLGQGQAKHMFLPEPWTDFVGSVLAEEMGLIGILVLLTGYTLFVWRGLRIARSAPDLFGVVLATAITAAIGGQAFFNLGVAMGVVPNKGLVLPFVSYGASAVMGHLVSIGILLNLSVYRGRQPRTPTIYRPTAVAEGLGTTGK
jgi:cell division protein FtsW